MVKRQNPNWLCKLGLHKWRNYGESVVITWKEPEIGRMSNHSKKVFTKRKCLRCGIGMKRRLVNNPDGTSSCIGWEPLSESEYEKDKFEEP